MSDPLSESVDRHLQEILSKPGSHDTRSQALLRLAANYRESVLRETVWPATGGVVSEGLMAGLKLPREAGDSVPLPKLIGTFQSGVAAKLPALIERRPEIVVQIGCGEGYYAAGLARLLPDAQILGFDESAAARALCRRTAEANGVETQIQFAERLDVQRLADFTGRRVLLLCSAADHAIALLEPHWLAALAAYDVIAELPGGSGANTSDAFAVRFGATHDVQLIDDMDRRIRLPEMLRPMREIDQLLMSWEMRGAGGSYAVMTARHPAPRRRRGKAARPRSSEPQLPLG